MTTANNEIKELKKELQHLSSLVEDKLSKTNGNGHTNVIGIDRSELKRMAHNAGENVRDFFSHKSEQAVAAKDACETAIVAHPFRSVLTAVAGGVLISALLRRK